MIAMKRCNACKVLKQLDGSNFQARPELKGKWSASCMGCLSSGRRPKAGRPRTKSVEVRARPGPKESDEARRVRLGREREREVVTLIRRYEAVRDVPGRD